jgi:hypothetical protein
MAAWATLRQVVLATGDIEGDGALLRERLALGKGFADPELADIGLSDDTLPLAAGAYLELVGPLGGDSSLHRFLDKRGPGGYALSVQHPDPVGVRERAAARGVRVVADLDVMGHRVVQLHPADVGVLLELDGIADPARWFWDGRDGNDPEPGALVDDVVSVTIPVADPEATAAQWCELLDLPATGAAAIAMGGRTVHFGRIEDGPKWTVTLRRAPGAGSGPVDGLLAGVHVRYVD